MALAYKIPYFSKEKRTSPADPASSEVQALSISPLAGEQRAASAGGAIGSPGGAARRPEYNKLHGRMVYSFILSHQAHPYAQVGEC